MSEQNMSITFSSEVRNLTEINSSFDKGILRVAYTGRNRNNSFISKETFEQCMPTIYNCPIVCRYEREIDSIGGHDMELVTDNDGNTNIVNITQPVGVIPESAQYWWEEIEDDSGFHEYLCIEALIWKRQEAYKKIKENGITEESMEIRVRNGSFNDGIYVIDQFEFTAFCLLGNVEPCFESAALQMFSCSEFKAQFDSMVKEFKENFSQLSTPKGVTDINSTEGGKENLEQEKQANIQESVQEELSQNNDTVGAGTSSYISSDNAADTPKDNENFSLTGEQFRNLLLDALHLAKVETSFGEMPQYCYVDYNSDLSEVYCHDINDWNLYGFTYSLNGDNVVINFDTKTRKKFAIVDFDNGEQNTAFAAVFAALSAKYQLAEENIESMKCELDELRKFKTDTENSIAESKREKVFSQFTDLTGIEAFDKLRADNTGMTAEELEEKCYAIRGKYGSAAKFSLGAEKTVKLKVEPNICVDDEPYGGIFSKYGFSANEQ